MKIRLEFKPQDMWVGAFWKTSGNLKTDIWICILPTLPIHITIEEQP